MGTNVSIAKQEEPKVVDYVVYRDTVANDRRIIGWLIAALIACVVLLFVTNLAWLKYESQFDTTTTTIDSEGNGVANYTGGNGGILYGENYNPHSDEAQWWSEENQSSQEKEITQPG